MTPRQLRANLRTEFLSQLRGATLADRLEQLERIAWEADVEPPAAGWVGTEKDTMLLLLGGRVVAGLTIQKVPFLDPLVLQPDTPWPALVLEVARNRAEGVLKAQGCDEYMVSIPEEMAETWHKYVRESEGTDSVPLRTYRRPL